MEKIVSMLTVVEVLQLPHFLQTILLLQQEVNVGWRFNLQLIVLLHLVYML